MYKLLFVVLEKKRQAIEEMDLYYEEDPELTKEALESTCENSGGPEERKILEQIGSLEQVVEDNTATNTQTAAE